MKRCKDCKPKQIPIFPLWDDRAKYWSKAKKEEKQRELCCDINKKKRFLRKE